MNRLILMRSAVAGGIIIAGGLSIFQDLVGKERYLALVSMHWVNGYISIPIAIFAIIIGCGFLVINYRRLSEPEVHGHCEDCACDDCFTKEQEDADDIE